MSFRVPNY